MKPVKKVSRNFRILRTNPTNHTTGRTNHDTDNPRYTDTRYNDKIRKMTIWMPGNLHLREDSYWEIMQEYCIKTSSNIYFGYLLESPHWGDSIKYPKDTLCEETGIKQGLSYISFCPYRILYNSEFILMEISLGTNTVVVTRIHCRLYTYMIQT